MRSYQLSPEALQDLQNIWDFIAEHSSSAADKLEDDFFAAFEKLARSPGLGHTRADLADLNLRFWPTRNYLIAYRRKRYTLQIVAVLHGARDIPEVIRKRKAGD